MVDGQELREEGFTVIHTPGHTPGHISLLHKEKRFLIMGDALANWNNTLGGPAVLFTPDPFNAQRSIWKLAKKYAKEIDTIVFGHGPPIMSGGGDRIKAHAAEIYGTEVK
jgi:glyoxylase-like metal-dependent hydrolase (beta-lactamase superfamily II)